MLELKQAHEKLITHLTAYRDTCFNAKGKLRNDLSTTLHNAFFTARVGTKTGYRKYTDFLKELEKQQFADTEALLTFLSKHVFKRGTVYTHMMLAIFDIVDCNQIHIDYMAGRYALMDGPKGQYGIPIYKADTPQAQVEGKLIILRIIFGQHLDGPNKKWLRTYFSGNKKEDFGQELFTAIAALKTPVAIELPRFAGR